MINNFNIFLIICSQYLQISIKSVLLLNYLI